MTREELAKFMLTRGCIDWRDIYTYVNSLEQRNTELEQRIKELQEPKTCIECNCYYDGECMRSKMKNVPTLILRSGCGQFEPKQN